MCKKIRQISLLELIRRTVLHLQRDSSEHLSHPEPPEPALSHPLSPQGVCLIPKEAWGHELP